MPLPTLRDYDSADLKPDIRGAHVYGADDEKLGTVDDAVFDRDSGDLRYLVVDAGWLDTRRFIIPVDQVFGRANRADDLLVGVTKADVKHLPPFEPECMQSEERFRNYEDLYRRSWRYDVDRTKVRPSSRLERFREGLRSRFARMKSRKVEPMIASTRSESERTREAPPSAREPASVLPHASAVYGMYRGRDHLDRAIEGLKDLGFKNTDISVLFPEKDKSKQFALQHNTKAPEGALAGGGTGLVVGGALGWLAGIGALAIPGVGPLLAAGPIVSAIAGAGVGSAIGGIAGALIGLGVPELEAKRYEAEVKKGGILVSVHCSDLRFAESARKVLERTGAKDVFLTEEKRAA
jgi:hypothetical protein